MKSVFKLTLLFSELRIYSDIDKLLNDSPVVNAQNVYESSLFNASAPKVLFENTGSSLSRSIWAELDNYHVSNSDALAKAYKDSFKMIKNLHYEFLALNHTNDPFHFEVIKSNYTFLDFKELLVKVMMQYKAWQENIKNMRSNHNFDPIKNWWLQTAIEIHCSLNDPMKSINRLKISTLKDLAKTTYRLSKIINYEKYLPIF